MLTVFKIFWGFGIGVILSAIGFPWWAAWILAALFVFNYPFGKGGS